MTATEKIFDHLASLFRENGIKKEDFLFDPENEEETTELVKYLFDEPDCYNDGVYDDTWISVERCRNDLSTYIAIMIDTRDRSSDHFLCDLYLDGEVRYSAKMNDSGEFTIVEEGNLPVTEKDEKEIIEMFDDSFDQFLKVSKNVKKIHDRHKRKE